MSGSIRHFVLICAAAVSISVGTASFDAGLGIAKGQAGPDDVRRNPFAAMLTQGEPQTRAVIAPPVAEEPPELVLKTIVLKFLDAKSLKEAVDRMVTAYGTVAINEKNNSIIICDTVENVERIMAEVKKADRTPRQIVVEVIIMDVKLNNDTEVGVNWDLLSHDLYDVVYRQNLTSTRLQSTKSDEETVGAATVFNTVGAGGDLSIISGTIRNVLHAIQVTRDVNILASPSTLVVSGKSATIEAVEEIPYEEITDTAQGGAGALTSTKFKNVGVTLNVEATITDGNNIFLSVDADQSVRTGESAKGVPVVDKRHATTALLLQDGQTIVIGGLRRTEKTKEISQVPILGDLPLIGLLFRSATVMTTRSELVVLLSPHICKDEPVPPAVLAECRRVREMSLLTPPGDEAGNRGEERKEQEAGESSNP